MSDRDYKFPGTPYVSQKKLMDALYESMENGTIGMFESPTGTGKTLALICAASTFLLAERSVGNTASTDGDDWVTAHASRKEMNEKMNDLREQSERRRLREHKVLSNSLKGQQRSATVKSLHWKKKHVKAAPSVGEERFILADFNEGTGLDEEEGLFSESEAENEKNEGEKPPIPRENLRRPPLRVVFATRTHSQLSQFIVEFRKTSLGANALNMNLPDTACNSILPVWALIFLLALCFSDPESICALMKRCVLWKAVLQSTRNAESSMTRKLKENR